MSASVIDYIQKMRHVDMINMQIRPVYVPILGWYHKLSMSKTVICRNTVIFVTVLLVNACNMP
jgi:hypothetical protein